MGAFRLTLGNIKIKPFGKIEQNRIIKEDHLFMIVYDKYPISPGHALIIVKRPIARFLDLTNQEKISLMEWISWTVKHLEDNLEAKPNGFNLGLNDGEVAGQTVGQLHFHVIPRYKNDVSDPRGGVRHVIPLKAKYWD